MLNFSSYFIFCEYAVSQTNIRRMLLAEELNDRITFTSILFYFEVNFRFCAAEWR